MSSIHRLAGPPFRNLLSYGLEVVIRGFLRSPLRWLMCRAQDDFSVLTLSIYVYDCCPLTTQMLGFMPLYVMLNIRFLCCLCGRKIGVFLFVEYSGVGTICRNYQPKGITNLSLLADGKVAF